MKFAKYLQQSVVPEWRYNYIQYKALKKRLKEIIEDKKDEAYTRTTQPVPPSPSVKSVGFARRQEARRRSRLSSAAAASRSHRSLFSASAAASSSDSATGALAASQLSPIQVGRTGRTKIHTLVPETTFAYEAEKRFFATLDKQTQGVETFYRAREDEFEQTLNELRDQIALYHTQTGVTTVRKPMRTMKLAFVELYRGFSLLRNYAVDNYTAIAKILKKHDKVVDWRTSKDYLAIVDEFDFHKQKKLSKMIDMTERLFADTFFKGDRSKAMYFLRNSLQDLEVTSFRGNDYLFLGIYLGICLVLFLGVLDLTVANNPVEDQIQQFYDHWPVYRGLFLILLHFYLFGLGCLVWERYRVNYRFIFQYDASTKPRISPITNLRAIAGLAALVLFFLVSVLLKSITDVFLATDSGSDNISDGSSNNASAASVGDNLNFQQEGGQSNTTYELMGSDDAEGGMLYVEDSIYFSILDKFSQATMTGIMLYILLAMLLWPFKSFYRNARIAIGRESLGCLISPFRPVTFRLFWFGDQLTSQTRALADMVYMACFLICGTFAGSEQVSKCPNIFPTARLVCTLFPYWVRLAQCLRRYRDTKDAFPHLVNGGKYCCSLLVTITSRFAPLWLWILTAIVSTVYSYSWDVLMDWGLFSTFDKQKNYLLREKLLYEKPWKYYVAMAVNLLLRCTWVLTISPTIVSDRVRPEMEIFILGVLEVIRRCHWNLYRLENEQLNNCGRFRAVNVVPLPYTFPVEEDDRAAEPPLPSPAGIGRHTGLPGTLGPQLDNSSYPLKQPTSDGSFYAAHEGLEAHTPTAREMKELNLQFATPLTSAASFASTSTVGIDNYRTYDPLPTEEANLDQTGEVGPPEMDQSFGRFFEAHTPK